MANNFHEFGRAVNARFQQMAVHELYVVDAPDLWERYLAAFPPGTDQLFRVRTEHDCSCCKNFVRNIGHVVAPTSDGGRMSVWEVDVPHPYDAVAQAMNDFVQSAPLKSIFRTKERRYGAESTLELRNDQDNPFRWHHFWCDVPQRNRTDKPEEARGRVNTTIGVMRRGLTELTKEALVTVADLIFENALYRGAEHKRSLDAFREMHAAYHATEPGDREAFLWRNAGNSAALFRNTVIGTLVVDLSAGEELDKAVRSFETKVAPLNYKRPTALITHKMIEDAVTKLKDLGLESAVERRFAKIGDVSVNNVLWVDNAVRGAMKGGALSELLAEEVKPAPANVKDAITISMEDFMARIVPQAESMQVLVENKHLGNFMSLTAPVHPDAGQLFKWDNGFAWSYDGDAADSIKQRVKRAGGKIDADLRVSLAWSNTDDLDLHAYDPSGAHIYYGNKKPGLGRCGQLDVDMNAFGSFVRDPVENIVWTAPRDGTYRIQVNQFRQREVKDVGFTLEVEAWGALHQFSYDRKVANTINCFTLQIKGNRLVSLDIKDPALKSGTTGQDKWGVTSETFVPVDCLMASPNHWDGNEAGNKHWFFILKGCRNPEPARGIYNEFLKGALDPHRKVFEVLASKTKCPVVPEQLSGVGFSSTRSDQATVLVKGHKLARAYRVQF